MATALEKTLNGQILIHNQVPTYRFSPKNKVATPYLPPYLQRASVIRQRPDALNIIVRLNKCRGGMR